MPYNDHVYHPDHGGVSIFHTTYSSGYNFLHAVVTRPILGAEFVVTTNDEFMDLTINNSDKSMNVLSLQQDVVARIVDAYNQAEREKAEAIECAKHNCNGDHSAVPTTRNVVCENTITREGETS